LRYNKKVARSKRKVEANATAIRLSQKYYQNEPVSYQLADGVTRNTDYFVLTVGKDMNYLVFYCGKYFDYLAMTARKIRGCLALTKGKDMDYLF
jgi:hypothetical protein